MANGLPDEAWDPFAQVLRGRWALGGAILTLSMMMGLTGLILAKSI